MHKKTKNVLGALLLITALLVSQIPGTNAEADSSSSFVMDGTSLIEYTGTEKSVSVPDTVKTISYSAFADNDSITEVILPDSVNSIEAAAFSNCDQLQRVQIGSGVKSLGSGAFSGCDKLSEVEFDEDGSFICEDAIIDNSSKSVLYEMLSGGGIESLRVPGSVKTIKEYAFWGVSSIQDITIPESVSVIPAFAFSSCVNLETVRLPATLTKIDLKAFSDCINLENIDVPVRASVHDTAFDGCARLAQSDVEEAEYEDTNTTRTTIDNQDVSGNDASAEDADELRNTVSRDLETNDDTESGASVYAGLSQSEIELKLMNEDSIGEARIVGGQAVVFIDNRNQTVYAGEESAESSESQEQVRGTDTMADLNDAQDTQDPSAQLMRTLSNAITESDEKGVNIPKYTVAGDKIASQAYYLDDNLSDYTFPDNITRIGDFAFARSGLTQIQIPETVTEIGYGAFYHADDLLTVSIPESVTKIEAYAFTYTDYLSDWINNGSGDYLIVGDGILLGYRGGNSRVSIPEGVKHISAHAFRDHKGIVSVSFPDSVRSIEEGAFESCSNLESILLNDGLETIADRAFSGCPIENPVIPGSVTAIGLGAFDCRACDIPSESKTVIFTGEVLPVVSTEKSSQRLSNEAYRVPSFAGYDKALVQAGTNLRGTLLSEEMLGFTGAVYEGNLDEDISENITADAADFLTDSAKIADVFEENRTTYTAADESVFVNNQSQWIDSDTVSVSLDAAGSNSFVLKITDDETVREAIMNGYQLAYHETLPDNAVVIDLSLWDATASIPITKLGKQTMSIAFAVPETLTGAGRLHVVCTDQDGQLEELAYSSFEQDGETMLQFDVSHFSPYAIYAFQNSTYGGQAKVEDGKVIFTNLNSPLDDTPDTGDLLEPKWVLIIGLLFASIALFFSKGKYQ